MNKFRNEMTIKLGTQEILLRPTFQNIAAMESVVGGLTYLALKFSRGGAGNKSALDLAKHLPSLSECAQIIFFNQANTKSEDTAKKQFSLEEIWDMVQSQGMQSVIHDVTMYLTRITVGQTKVDEIEAQGAQEKKA